MVRPGINVFDEKGVELDWDYEHDTRFFNTTNSDDEETKDKKVEKILCKLLLTAFFDRFLEKFARQIHHNFNDKNFFENNFAKLKKKSLTKSTIWQTFF